MKHLSVLPLATVLALVLAVTVVQPALGQSASPAAKPATATLTFGGATSTKTKGQLALSATLKGPDGKPLTERSVDFYQQVELFGDRHSYLGSATTDGTGVATLIYEATQTGQQSITVAFPGNDELAEAQATGTIQVKEAGTPFEHEPQPLALVSRWLPVGLAAMVFATWVVLLGVFLSTVLGIRAAVPALVTEVMPKQEPNTAQSRTADKRTA